ncbi:desumoylating isopeptidase 1-like [Choristoneura fumiferana]|uniref:desumoylating isopeptidase 1-like n=1 Tax=Choristoneura fumiferana TaxID=7141 RepID=UPI003D155773
MSAEGECEGEPVDLYIYDLTQGLAAILSPAIMGRQVEGVWHTSLVVFGREYYYGGGGVACAPIGGTMAGRPREVQRLGRTQVPPALFRDYLQGLAATTFTGAAYQLLEHNCNHFTDEVAQFLCGARVPKHIVRQPDADLPPALRHALTELLAGAGQPVATPRPGVRYDRQDSPDYLTLNTQIEEASTWSGAREAWSAARTRVALAGALAFALLRRARARHASADPGLHSKAPLE